MTKLGYEMTKHATQKDARKLFNQSKEVSSLDAAFHSLDKALKALPATTHHSNLFMSGYGVYSEAHQLVTKKGSRIDEETLAEILHVTAHLVAGNERHIDGAKGYRDDILLYYRLSNRVRHFPFGKLLAGAMTALIGTAIVVTSGIIGAVSFGLLLPFSLLGFTFGASIIIGGVTIGTGAIGVGTLMGSGQLFFNSFQKNPLRSKMNQLVAAAQEHYGFSP